MPFPRYVPWILAAVLVTAVASIYACSNGGSTNPYAPPPGGGGTVLNLPLPASGGSQTFTFGTAGTFAYKCGIHPTIMTGDNVVVSASSTMDSTVVTVVGVSTPGFSPASVTIKVGGKVRWVNPNGIAHSVVNQ